MNISLEMDDLRDPSYVPEGWIRTLKNNRVIFKTSPPARVTIQNKRMLIDYQKTSKFLEADPEKMDFRGAGSRNVDKLAVVTDDDWQDEFMEVVDCEEDVMEVDAELDSSSNQMPTKDGVIVNTQSATERLEIDPAKPVDHGKELEEASKILAKVLLDSSQLNLNVDVESFKEELLNTETTDDFIETLQCYQSLSNTPLC